jgi:hypothetical protein
MVGGIVALDGAPAQAVSGIVAPSIPGSYIKSYGQRAKRCSELDAPGWVRWVTYSAAFESHDWVVAASSKKLCHDARRTSLDLIYEASDHDGAGQNLDDMINFAAGHNNPSTRRAPKPFGPSWKCTILPSFWGRVAWHIGHGHVSNDALSGATGAAAGAGFCEQGAIRKNGKYVGGQFFSWIPDSVTCNIFYRLKQVPDPNFPGETKPASPFPANLWGDYDQLPCPPGSGG